MGCLDEQTIVTFVTGKLTGAALAEAERHLLACPQCTALVGFAAPAVGPRRPTPDRAPGPEATVGRYQLLRQVGRGGVSEVWAAHDPKLNREVAIKILRGDNYDEVDAQRLLREAQAIATLSHPNVVTMYDGGTANGRVFLAMELIDGETLAVWRARRHPSLEEVLRVFTLAGRGLAAAHRAGIVHRDFKPQNVMVARDGGVRVMDFGLAARGPEASAGQPRLTRKGWILGTPKYMSPEQLRGEPVDPRADQYSFCVALYEALYGERPFEGETFAALRSAVLAGRLRRPPLVSRVPARLRAVVLRGLASKRTRRFPDMDALLLAIAAASRGGTRLTTRVAMVAVAGAALTVGTELTWRQLSAARRPAPCANVRPRLASAWPSQNQVARRREVRAAFLSSAVPDAQARYERTAQLLDAYGNAWAAVADRNCAETGDGGTEARARSAERARCLDERLAELDALTELFAHGDARVVSSAIAAAQALPPVETCNATAVEADARGLDDDILRRRIEEMRGRLRRLRAMAAAGHDAQALQPISALAEEVRTTGYEPLLAETLLAFAHARSSVDPDRAVALYEEAFERSEAIPNYAFAAEAATELTAIVGAIQHHFAAGERWTRIAEEDLNRSPDERFRIRMLDRRGALHAARGRWRLAATDFAAAVEAGGRSLGTGHARLTSALVGLSRAQFVLGDPDQALVSAERALTIAATVYPADSYEVGAARLERGRARLALLRPEEARPDLETSRASFERTFGPDHPRLAEPLTALGQLALAERRPEEAQALLERAWKIRSSHLADGGAREETAFALARALAEAAPEERRRAINLANEARDGYSALPDLASQLTAVDSWLDAQRASAAVRWRPRPL